MKLFVGFIVSVAVIFFCFSYYLEDDGRPTDTELASITREVRAETAMAATTVISIKSSNSVTITAASGKWKSDTVKYMTGGYFWQQVMIKFSDGVLIEHTDGSTDNQFYLLNRMNLITGPGVNRMLVVLDSLSGRLVWREIIRDGKDLHGGVDTLRVQFLLLRRPQS